MAVKHASQQRLPAPEMIVLKYGVAGVERSAGIGLGPCHEERKIKIVRGVDDEGGTLKGSSGFKECYNSLSCQGNITGRG